MSDADGFWCHKQDAGKESSTFVQALVNDASTYDKPEWLALFVEEVRVDARYRACRFAESLHGGALPAKFRSSNRGDAVTLHVRTHERYRR